MISDAGARGYRVGALSLLPKTAGDLIHAKEWLEKKGARIDDQQNEIRFHPIALLSNTPEQNLPKKLISNSDLQYFQLFEFYKISLFGQSKIDDGAIRYLRHLHTAKMINLRGTSISEDKARELARALPRCSLLGPNGHWYSD